MGGQFNYRMEAKDGSMGFDFLGTLTKFTPKGSIHFQLEDNRTVTVDFIEADDGTMLIETFGAEDENSSEAQKQRW